MGLSDNEMKCPNRSDIAAFPWLEETRIVISRVSFFPYRSLGTVAWFLISRDS